LRNPIDPGGPIKPKEQMTFYYSQAFNERKKKGFGKSTFIWHAGMHCSIWRSLRWSKAERLKQLANQTCAAAAGQAYQKWVQQEGCVESQ
jgi:hypothetical protein